MKTLNSLLTALLTVITVFAQGQSTIDFGLLPNDWTQGRIDATGNVVKAEVNRGGWYQLAINTDSTLVFSDPFTCGFGHKRQGNWAINKADTTVTFHFYKRAGYMNTPGTTDINETETYKITKLNAEELILSKLGEDKKYMAFLPTSKTRE